MDAAAISTQLAMQAKSGVVGNSNGEAGSKDASKGDFLAVMLQTMKGVNAQQINAQQLIKDGEKNAQALIAQMFAQNPMLMALMSQSGISAEDLGQLLTQSTEGGAAQILQGLQGLVGVQDLQGLMGAQGLQNGSWQSLIQNLEASPEAGSQLEIFLNALNEAFKAEQAQQQGVQVQAQAEQKAQPVQQQQAAVPVAVQVVKADTSETEKAQSARLFEQANAESMAQRSRVKNVSAEVEKITAQTEKQPADSKPQSTEAQQVKEEKAKSSADTGKETDINAAQQSFGKQLEDVRQAATAQPKSVNQASADEVVRQTAQGIKQNLALGKEEFVMKLKPEGLGEITVKLESLNGKVTLQLTAQNQSVQKMLEGEMDALRQAVKPYNVEVRELASGNNTNMNMSFSSQNSQQQFTGHMNGRFSFGEGGSKQQSSYEAFLNGEASDDTDDTIIPTQTINSALDRYI